MPFNDKVIGLLGGGQLGRMFLEAASRLNVRVKILDAPNSSAKKISNAKHIDGSFSDPAAVEQLAKSCDVLTIEIEHVDTYAMEKASTPGQCQPTWETIRLIQDKYAQKQHLTAHNIAVAEFEEVPEKSPHDHLTRLAAKWGYPIVLKAKKGAYDGRGNFLISSADHVHAALEALSGRELYVEKGVPFTKELAVLVAKTKDGILPFPAVETIHRDGICNLVYAPAPDLSAKEREDAQSLACRAVSTFTGKGVFAVEMFYCSDDGRMLVNEMAPRPHNSGHHTIDTCAISQYDAHLRAILDLPIPAASLDLASPAVMLNILGTATPDSDLTLAEQALTIPGARVHLYDKGEARPGRKMGHVTAVAPSLNQAMRAIHPLVRTSDSLYRDGSQHAPAAAPATPPRQPLVSITTGSISDQDRLKPAYKLLDDLAIPFEKRITSAHRTPAAMSSFALSAESRGVKVIIAAAGGAAHLAGMVAAYTTVPVVGLPIRPSLSDGWDSVVSMTNMPRGEPVLTVGVDNAVNAALGAAGIVGAFDEGVRERLRKHRSEAARESLANDAVLQKENGERLRAGQD